MYDCMAGAYAVRVCRRQDSMTKCTIRDNSPCSNNLPNGYALETEQINPTPVPRMIHLRCNYFQARLYQVALDELIVQRLAERRGRALNNNTSSLQGGDLGVGVTLSSADNGTGVAHSPAGRRRDTSDEADNGLVGGVVLLEEVGGVLLSGSTNLADHDNTVCLGVLEEDLQAVDEVGAGEGVTADTDDERLAKAGLGGLVDGLVGEGSGAGDDTDATALVDEARHDADLALALLWC
jgi:hypothetical protein